MYEDDSETTLDGMAVAERTDADARRDMSCGTFGVRDTAEATGVPRRSIYYMLQRRLVVPAAAYEGVQGRKLAFSPRNVLEILLVRELEQHGIEQEEVEEIVGALKKAGYFRWLGGSEKLRRDEPAVIAMTDHGKAEILTAPQFEEMKAHMMNGHRSCYLLSLTGLEKHARRAVEVMEVGN